MLCNIICVCAVPSAVEAAEDPFFDSRYCISIWFCAAVKDVAPPLCCAASICMSACAWASEMMVAAFDVFCADRLEDHTGISRSAANPGNINLLEIRRIMTVSLFAKIWESLGCRRSCGGWTDSLSLFERGTLTLMSSNAINFAGSDQAFRKIRGEEELCSRALGWRKGSNKSDGTVRNAGSVFA